MPFAFPTNDITALDKVGNKEKIIFFFTTILVDDIYIILGLFGSICLWHTKQKSQRVIFSQQTRPADKVHPLSAFFIIIL